MINKVEMVKSIKEELKHRKLELTDKQIDNCINEAQEMFNTSVEYFLKSNNPEQIAVGSFLSGVLFGVDGCERKRETLRMKTKDGGKNWNRF